MKRRQALAGLGALMGGGAATIGTGAFTSVTADRTVAVQVADENNAYLGVKPLDSDNGSSFASQSSANELFLDFNGAGPNVSGSGPGVRSDYEFDDVFQVSNQGTQTYFVSIDKIDQQSGDVEITFYEGSDPSQPLHTNDLELSTGNSANIGVAIDLNASAEFKDISNTTTISADASGGGSIISK